MTTMIEQWGLDAQRLGERSDVAHANVGPDGIYIVNSDGLDMGPYVSFSEAVGDLVGADKHLVGLAACACNSCGYVGPR